MASSTLTESVTTSLNEISDAISTTIQNALDLARSANTAFRAHDDVAVSMPGGMFGHVRNGKLVGFGLEPIGDVLVDSQRKVSSLVDGSKGRVLWGRVAAVAGGSAAAASSVAGVATAIILGRRRTDR